MRLKGAHLVIGSSEGVLKKGESMMVRTNEPDEHRLRSERGVALAFMALLLFVLLGASALAIDLAFLYGARTEAQRTADAAALAGAGVLYQTMDEAAAEAAAIEWGSRNRIRGEQVVILPGDVDVIPDSQKVRVRVHRTADRGSAIPTIFARSLGFVEVDVRTLAAAQAFPAGAIDGACLLPFAMPDRWQMANGQWPTMYDDYNPPADRYVSWSDDSPGNPATGFSYPESVGYQMQIRGVQSQGADYHPGWWRHAYFWDFPGAPNGVPGNQRIIQAIRDCVEDDPMPVHMEDWYQTQPGFLSGPLMANAFNFVINQDPAATWNDACNCVLRNGEPVENSPRIRPLALFNPNQPPQQGAFPVQVTNFVNVFVESVVGGQGGGGPGGPGGPGGGGPGGPPGNPGQPEVWVRYMGVTGIAPGQWTPDAGPVPRSLRLVE